jgi:hypothetical protein
MVGGPEQKRGERSGAGPIDTFAALIVMSGTSDPISVDDNGVTKISPQYIAGDTALSNCYTAMRHAESLSGKGDYQAAIYNLTSVVKALENTGLAETKLYAQALLSRGRMHIGIGDVDSAEADTLQSAALFVRLLAADASATDGADFLNQKLSTLRDPQTPVSVFHLWSARVSLLSIQVRLHRVRREENVEGLSKRADELISILEPYNSDINLCGLFADCLRSRSYCELLRRADSSESRIEAALLQEKGYDALKRVLPADDERLVAGGIELAELWCYSNQVNRAYAVISEVAPVITEGSLHHVSQLWITAGVYLRAAALIAADPSKLTREPLIADLWKQLGPKLFPEDNLTMTQRRPQSVIEKLTVSGGVLLNVAAQHLAKFPFNDPWIRGECVKILQQRVVFAAILGSKQLMARYQREIDTLSERE